MSKKRSLQTFNLPKNIIMMSKEDFIMNYMTYDEEEDEYYFKKLDGKDWYTYVKVQWEEIG